MRKAQKIKNAKELRRNMTEMEKKLWFHLRAHRFYGLKFKRQYTVGPYITDFACLEHNLIIELDGGQHATQAGYDFKRTHFLQDQGFTILRFWNNEVGQNMDAVLEVIASACRRPLPNPLPQAGEGSERQRAGESVNNG